MTCSDSVGGCILSLDIGTKEGFQHQFGQGDRLSSYDISGSRPGQSEISLETDQTGASGTPSFESKFNFGHDSVTYAQNVFAEKDMRQQDRNEFLAFSRGMDSRSQRPARRAERYYVEEYSYHGERRIL